MTTKNSEFKFPRIRLQDPDFGYEIHAGEFGVIVCKIGTDEPFDWVDGVPVERIAALMKILVDADKQIEKILDEQDKAQSH